MEWDGELLSPSRRCRKGVQEKKGEAVYANHHEENVTVIVPASFPSTCPREYVRGCPSLLTASSTETFTSPRKSFDRGSTSTTLKRSDCPLPTFTRRDPLASAAGHLGLRLSLISVVWNTFLLSGENTSTMGSLKLLRNPVLSMLRRLSQPLMQTLSTKSEGGGAGGAI